LAIFSPRFTEILTDGCETPRFFEIPALRIRIYEISKAGIEILAIIHGRLDFNSDWDEKDH
jgi:hypothetical protein